jgi:hypothetical protein
MNSNKKKAISRLALAVAAPAFAFGVMGLASQGSAEVIQATLGAAGPNQWAILTLGGSLTVDDTLVMTGPGTTVGNVGATSTTQVKLSGSAGPSIQGNLYLGSTSTVDHPELVNGTIFTNQDALLNPAAAQAFAAGGAGGTFDLMANTFSVPGGSITGTMTLTATGAVNVTDLTNITLGNNEILTLSGTAGQQFVINFSGQISLNGSTSGGKILLAGGLTTHDVIFNYTGAAGGDAVKSSGGSSNDIPNAIFSGVYLVENASINLSPGQINGEAIGAASGYDIKLVSGSQVINPPTTVPVPASLPAGLAGMAMLGVWRWRKAARAR